MALLIRILCCFLWVTWVLQINNSMARADIFTSIEKMKEVFFHEKRLISGIKRALKNVIETPETREILRFCHDRQEKMKLEKIKERTVSIKHPNGVYTLIRHFAEIYTEIRSNIEKTSIPYLQSVLQDIPSSLDVTGARLSLISLQEVYDLDPYEMAQGNFLGHHGPSLGVLDMFNIGLAAFEDQKYHLSTHWFNVTGAKLVANKSITEPSIERVVSLLQQSQERFDQINIREAPKSVKMSSLLRVLNTQCSENYTKYVLDAEMKKGHTLCAKMDNKYLKTGPKHVCVYRSMLLPYYRMAEEILSASPYISLIHNITTAKESNAAQKLASRKLFRAEVQDVQGSKRSDYRTSHVAFLDESESKHLTSLTRRMGYLTGLNCISHPNGHRHHQSAGEKYQVVNYGIGGHYSIHLDTYETSYPESQDILKNSGNRIATILIYLSAVESGGSTVFPWLDIAVPPLQFSALMWYNMDTSGTVDFRTRHAGCPVLIGDKWVMNKWILSHANTFKRPCGLRETANQRRIETIVKR